MSSKVVAGGCFALLWGLGLFGVMEADLWSAKVIIMTVLPSLSFGLERFFYG